MKSAEVGNSVKVHYTGKVDDGIIFDSSIEREPLEFTIGNGQLIKGFEDVVVGMNVGDKKTVKITASEAYGVRRDELVMNVDRARFPHNINLTQGLELSIKRPDGGVLNVVITSVGEDYVTLDANHPLAGKDLTFDIEVVEIL